MGTITRTGDITRASAADRRRFLHDLASEVAAGTEGYAQVVRFTDLLACVASAECPDRHGVFSRLVADVKTFTAFCGDEAKWLTAHRIVPTGEARETYHGLLEERIDRALDELLAMRSVA